MLFTTRNLLRAKKNMRIPSFPVRPGPNQSTSGSRLLRKLDTQDQMFETPAVNLVAGLDGVVPVCEADKGEPLGQARVPILGQEYSRHPSEPLEQIAKLLLLGHLRHLLHGLQSQQNKNSVLLMRMM